jgi:Cupin domain
VGFGNAMQQHAKVAELYKADLVTSDGKEASLFLAELAPGANMGKHYHPGDAFAYILEGTMLLEIAGGQSVTLKSGQSGSLPPRTYMMTRTLARRLLSNSWFSTSPRRVTPWPCRCNNSWLAKRTPGSGGRWRDCGRSSPNLISS